MKALHKVDCEAARLREVSLKPSVLLSLSDGSLGGLVAVDSGVLVSEHALKIWPASLRWTQRTALLRVSPSAILQPT